MLIKFSPTDDEHREYEFKPRKLMSVEAEAIEKRVGKPYNEVVQDAVKGSALARRAIVWVFEKRAHPALTWESFDFPVGAVDFEFDAEEIDVMLAEIGNVPGVSDEDRAEAAQALTAMKASAPAVPKAPEPTDDSST